MEDNKQEAEEAGKQLDEEIKGQEDGKRSDAVESGDAKKPSK